MTSVWSINSNLKKLKLKMFVRSNWPKSIKDCLQSDFLMKFIVLAFNRWIEFKIGPYCVKWLSLKWKKKPKRLCIDRYTCFFCYLLSQMSFFSFVIYNFNSLCAVYQAIFFFFIGKSFFVSFIKMVRLLKQMKWMKKEFTISSKKMSEKMV